MAMNYDASQDFVRSILSMPLAWRQRMRHSPPVSQVLFTHGDIETMTPESLSILRSAILDTVKMALTSLLSSFPDGEVVVGTSAHVRVRKESLKTLWPGRNLDAEVIRAALGCGEWSLRDDVVVVDPVAFKEGRGQGIGVGVDTILFPVQAPTHWLLLVAKRLSGSTMLGSMNFPDADLWICDSTSTSTATFSENQAKEQVIETVIAYLRLATGNDKFTCVKTQTKVAESSLVDSGIAATMNALSIIDGEAFEKEMGEVRCWELRERFLRGVVGSVRFNEQVENGSQGGSVLGAKNGYRRASVEDVDEEEEEEVTFVSSQPRRSEDARPSDSNSPAANKRRLIQKKERPMPSPSSSLDCRWLDQEEKRSKAKEKGSKKARLTL